MHSMAFENTAEKQEWLEESYMREEVVEFEITKAKGGKQVGACNRGGAAWNYDGV